MSALQTGEVQKLEDGTKLYSYRQPVPTSSYLIALAAGNLESRVEKKNNIRIYILYTVLFEIFTSFLYVFFFG